jgi:hypothetical protein
MLAACTYSHFLLSSYWSADFGTFLPEPTLTPLPIGWKILQVVRNLYEKIKEELSQANQLYHWLLNPVCT